MIDSKTAVQKAKTYFSDLFPSASDVRLEEVERSVDGLSWLVTFSFAKPEIVVFGSPFANPHRDYKMVKLDSNTGEPQGVKIRAFAS